MKKISLNGKWMLSGANFINVEGKVPGCVHTDLLNNKLIVDPYYRDNESKLMYIGKTDWIYEKNFTLSAEFIKFKKIKLICCGLDTFAHIYINNNKIAETDNMFRTWEFDVKRYLIVGENTIKIVLKSTYPYMEEKLKDRFLKITGVEENNQHRILGSNYVRKMQCNYGWDWGPMCVTAGIWRDIELIGYEETRISDVQIIQKHNIKSTSVKGNKVTSVYLEVIMNLTDEFYKKYKAIIEVSYNGKTIKSKEIIINDLTNSTLLEIKDPKLWWPNNLGEQHLYNITITLLCENSFIDKITETIGLRTLFLDIHEDKFGETFQFVVNGVPFFAKGANWIPIDTFVTRGTKEFYRQLLQEAKNANMNFIRVWGGGIYEDDIFYELCDELGLCVWQDFQFACSAYPVYDKAYMETVKEEIKDNVIRLRNHPSLALWCGNNEIEYMGNMITNDGKDGTMTWDEYKLLFDNVIPSIVSKYDGQHSYWASSPMDRPSEIRTDGKDPRRGDAHLWDVWHGLKPFEWYRTCDHRFNSEFGFQSFPEPMVVNSYTKEEDRNITSYVMEKHQRSGIGNATIIHYMLSWFKLPKNFEMLLWTSQILQSLAIKYGVENWRRKMPRGMGTLYWQLNDVWPGASWSSIDYAGNLKALHYNAKKFYNPILVSGIEDKEKLSVDLYLSNDLLENIKGTINYRIYRLDGKVLEEKEFDASIKANSSKKVKTINLNEKIKSIGKRKIIIYYYFKVNEKIISENTTYFTYPKHLCLEKPNFKISVNKITKKVFKIELKTDKPALWIWPDLKGIKAKYSDRFFDLFNEYSKEVIITLDKDVSLEQFEKILNVYSIVDTY